MHKNNIFYCALQDSRVEPGLLKILPYWWQRDMIYFLQDVIVEVVEPRELKKRLKRELTETLKRHLTLTDILISGIFFKGNESALLDIAELDRVTCEDVIEELEKSKKPSIFYTRNPLASELRSCLFF